jgi:hypothetical protein
MRRITARDFMNMDVLGNWPLPDEKLEIEFDDGIMVTNTRRTIVSWFCWELHRQFPLTPIYMRHHIGNAFFTAQATLVAMSNIIRDLHYAYFDPTMSDHQETSYDREFAWKTIARVENEIYNHLSINLEEWHTSTNAFHLLELYDHPAMKEAREAIKPNQLAITRAYERSSEILMKDPTLLHNPIVRGLRSKQIKLTQMLQILVCRGYLTDIDQIIFRKPITVGFFEGLTTMHDIMIESCSAKKALISTKKPLRIVEYFNRKMQLSTVVVHTLLWKDCKSERYASIHVDPGMFRSLEGKFYLTNKGQLSPITEFDRHLIGQTIQIRSAMFCNHRGEGAVCRVCFGENAWSVPNRTNIGHVCSTEMCHEGSQLVLSTKHYDGSSVVDEIIISDHDADYICVAMPDLNNQESDNTDSSAIKFNPRLSKMEPVLILESRARPPVDNASGLPSITPHTAIEHLSIHRVTSFREVQIRVRNLRNEEYTAHVSVSQGARLGALSKPMLRYIQENGYTVMEDGKFMVDLKDWNFDEVVFGLPMRHSNMLDYMSEIEHFIRSPSKKDDQRVSTVRKLKSYTDPVEALIDFHDLVSSKLSVNICHLEVILLSLMRPADDPDDYCLPDIECESMFEEHGTLMAMRSAGGLLAYERQPDTIDNVDSYLIKKRPPHVLDPFVHVSE